MYLTYDRYAALGGGIGEGEFGPLSVKAEALLDEWTSGRIDKGGAKDEVVELALCMIVDDTAGGGGRRLTSFSNGVDSFGFADDGGAYGDLYDRVCAILPAELVSLAVCDAR